MTSLQHRQSLRTELRSKRRNVPESQQILAAEELCQQFIGLGLHLRFSRIGLYWPVDGEISPLPLLYQLSAMGTHCFLPQLHPFNKKNVRFARYTPGDALVPNRYSISEPNTAEISPIWSLDLLLIPLVGFDSAGGRLGMGGGYYDRSLAVSTKTHFGPLRIGLAHRCQEVEHVPVADWDIPMNGILTDDRYLPCL